MFEASRLFISYRRSDAERTARALCEALRARFGAERVFFDTSDIPFGEDFQRVVHERIAASEVVVVVIGPGWLSATNDKGRRLLQSDDPVRFELETALQLGKRIVPLRLDGALAPSADQLPEPLRALAVLNMPELRGASFDIDIDELVRQLLGLPRPDIGFGARLKAVAQGGPAATLVLVAALLAASWTGLFDLLGLHTTAQRWLLRAALDEAVLPAERLAGRIVLVGVTALAGSTPDVHAVQDGLRQRTVFGVELHADAMRALAGGRVPRLPTLDRQLASTLLACVLGAGVAVWGFERRAWRRRGVLFAVAAAWLAGAWWLARHDVLTNIFTDIAALCLAAAAMRAVQVVTQRLRAFRRISA
ncbi:MAG: TIR domain-containing protein [Rubrivivax sp.]